jgi:uroporphyrinogen decarboxylase
VIVFAKGAYGARERIGQTSCDVVGLDWNMDIRESRKLVGPNKTLQGNLDPATLYASYDVVKSETRRMIDQFGPSRHIANFGHGVYPDMEADKVKCFIDEVKEYSRKNETSGLVEPDRITAINTRNPAAVRRYFKGKCYRCLRHIYTR